MYAVVSVIVDGALESEETYHDEVLMTNALDEIRDDSLADGVPTEVYVIYHDHDESVECECIQYETSHKPKFVYNIPQRAGEWQS